MTLTATLELSETEWQELTDLLTASSDYQLAAAVRHVITTAGRAAASLDEGVARELAEALPNYDPMQLATTRVLSGGQFYRALLAELRRRHTH
jgi:hypothetical protein